MLHVCVCVCVCGGGGGCDTSVTQFTNICLNVSYVFSYFSVNLWSVLRLHPVDQQCRKTKTKNLQNEYILISKKEEISQVVNASNDNCFKHRGVVSVVGKSPFFFSFFLSLPTRSIRASGRVFWLSDWWV